MYTKKQKSLTFFLLLLLFSYSLIPGFATVSSTKELPLSSAAPSAFAKTTISPQETTFLKEYPLNSTPKTIFLPTSAQLSTPSPTLSPTLLPMSTPMKIPSYSLSHFMEKGAWVLALLEGENFFEDTLNLRIIYAPTYP